jgi:hypothetical protein
MSNSKFENTLIYLIGFPGTGKYTIAQEIVGKADFKLVDNHLINNPIFSLIQLDGKTPMPMRVWDNVVKIWDVVADTLIHLSPPEGNFVLTNSLAEGDEFDLRHYERIKNIADQRRGHFVPVRLTLDVDEHRRRITVPARKLRHKETNPEAPARYAAQSILNVVHPHVLTLDVTHLSAAEAADIIVKHAASLRKNA